MFSSAPQTIITYKVLGQVNPEANVPTTLYATTSEKNTSISTIGFCNQSATEITFSFAIKPIDAVLGPEHYIKFNVPIPPYATIEVKGGLTLKDSEIVVITPSNSLSVSAFGSEYYVDSYLSLSLSTIFELSEFLDREVDYNRFFEDEFEFVITYQNESTLDFSSDLPIYDIFNTYALDLEDVSIITDEIETAAIYVINLDEEKIDIIDSELVKNHNSDLFSSFETVDLYDAQLARLFEQFVTDEISFDDTFEKESLFFLDLFDSNAVSSSTLFNISSLFLLDIEETFNAEDSYETETAFFLDFDENYGFIDTNIGKTFTSIVSENVSVSDEFERTSNYNLAPTESVSFNDVSLSRDEVLNLSDIFGSTDINIAKSVTIAKTEDAVLSDTNLIKNIDAKQSDTFIIDDSNLSKLPSIVVSDTTSTAEDFVVNTEFVIVDDDISFTDVNFTKVFDQNLSDTSIIDDTDLRKLFVTGFSDSFTEIDVSVVKSYNSVATDSAGFTDANLIKEYVNVTSDSVVFVDSFSDIQELTLANSFETTDSLATSIVTEITTSLYTWGLNNSGQLGDGTTTQRTIPTLIGADIWAKISGGLFYSMGTKEDNKLFAWGANGAGQLGDGTKTQRTAPVQIGTDDWTEFSAGQLHSAAIRSDGKLFTWGRNTYGQLGDGTTTERLSPTQIGTDNWLKVEAGAEHTIAIRSDGKLFAWGRNNEGQLGDGTIVNKSTPTQIGVSNWKSISTNSVSNLAIRSDDKLFAWGRNTNGQLGDGTTTQRNSPVQIGTSNWKDISISSHSLAIRSDDKLFAWGSNTYGQLGDGTTTQRTSPVQIGTLNWLKVFVGSIHSMGISSDNKLYTWGDNFYGQLGDGTTTQRNTPTLISRLYNIQSISAGGEHSLGLVNPETVVLTLTDSYSLNSLYGSAFDPAAGFDEAIAFLSLSAPYIYAYPFSDAGFGTKYADPVTSLTNDMWTVDFIRTGNAIIMGSDISPYITAYEWNVTTGFGAKYSDPAVLPTSRTVRAKFSYESAAVGITHANSPYISVYQWNSATGFGTKYTAPSFTADSGEAIDFKPGLIAFTFDPPGLGTSSAPGIRVYNWTTASGFGTKYSDPVGFVIPYVSGAATLYSQIIGYNVEFKYTDGDVRPSGIFVGGSFSSEHNGSLIGYPWSSSGFGTKYSYTNITNPDGVWNLSVANDTFAMYKNDNFINSIAVHNLLSTGWGTQYSNPDGIPRGYVKFNSAGSKLAIAGVTATDEPYTHVYSFTKGVGFGTKYSSPTITPPRGAGGAGLSGQSGFNVAWMG